MAQNTMVPDPVKPAKPAMSLEFSPSQCELAQWIRTRRTINDFQPETPPREAILQAIDVARWAPNHKLTEPWRFYLLGPATIQSLITLNTQLVTAEKGADAASKKKAKWEQVPGWLAVTSQRSSDPIRDWENSAAVCCAIQNLLLFLWSLGIGTKWSTGALTRSDEFAKLLGIDLTTERVVGLIWYGYPAASPLMRRRPVSEVTLCLP
jgi:nitroreductase